MSSSDDSANAIRVILGLVLIVFLVCRGSFVTPDVAEQHLEAMGHTEVEVESSHWFLAAFHGCGSDAAVFKTVSTNAAGNRVKLSVCVGWPLKGATIRGR